jgi:hypothetical protein
MTHAWVYQVIWMVKNFIDSHFAMKFKPSVHSLAPNKKKRHWSFEMGLE